MPDFDSTQQTEISSDSTEASAVRVARKLTLAQWGIVCVAAAVAFGLFPRFSGVGWFWSLALVLGGIVIWRRETGFTFVSYTFVASPYFLPVYTALVFAQAWRMLEFSFVSLLWTTGAALLIAAIVRKVKTGVSDAALFTEAWDGRGGLLRGYGHYIALGVAFCFVSLLMKWGQTPGISSLWYTGGVRYVNSYNYYTQSFEGSVRYTPMAYSNMWYYPGFTLSGRSRPYTLLAECVLLGALAWGAYQRAAPIVSPRDKQIGYGLAIGLFVWWLNALRGLVQTSLAGPLLFFAGAALVAVGVAFRVRGEIEGPWDLPHLWQKVRAKRSAAG